MKIQTAKDLAKAAGCTLTWVEDGCQATRFTPACRGFWSMYLDLDSQTDNTKDYPIVDILAKDLNRMSKKAFMGYIADAKS